MALEQTAHKALGKINDALAEYDLSEEERAQVLKIIGKTLIKTIEETTDTHREASVICCGPEADLAHKIEEEMERKKIALIANLMAMR